MKALKGGDQFLSTVGLLMDDIRYDATFFYQLCYSHVRREGNIVAHSLARYALEITNFMRGWRMFHHLYFLLSEMTLFNKSSWFCPSKQEKKRDYFKF